MMKILLTNDDGIDAPGLRAAFEAVRELGNVHVVAPKSEKSACSHAITLSGPMRVERVQHPVYGEAHAVEGSPADCVRLAVSELHDHAFDLVLSGINRGANAGVDTFYSGTIAGAREAAIFGLKAIAFSHAIQKEVEVNWDHATRQAKRMLAELLHEPLPAAGFWSVNFPPKMSGDGATRVHRVPVATGPMPMQFHRRDHQDGKSIEFGYANPYWSREVDQPSDYSVIRDGDIAVTAIPLYGKF